MSIYPESLKTFGVYRNKFLFCRRVYFTKKKYSNSCLNFPVRKLKSIRQIA